MVSWFVFGENMLFEKRENLKVVGPNFVHFSWFLSLFILGLVPLADFKQGPNLLAHVDFVRGWSDIAENLLL